MTSTRATVGIGLAVLVALFVGVQSLIDDGPPALSVGTAERVAVPERIVADNTFPNPAEAAEARARQAGLDEAHADRFVLIYGDEQTVDLRVRVNGADCRWFGVVGLVQDGKIAWSNAGSGDGQPC